MYRWRFLTALLNETCRVCSTGLFMISQKLWFWYQLTARTDLPSQATEKYSNLYLNLYLCCCLTQQVKHNVTFIVNVFCVYNKRQSKIKLHSFLFFYQIIKNKEFLVCIKYFFKCSRRSRFFYDTKLKCVTIIHAH